MIAVVGATGFTGHRIARRVREVFPDEELVVVIRESSDRRRLDGITATTRLADIGDLASLRSALTGARLVVHTPSLGFGHAPTVVAAIEAVRPERAVIFSTTSIFTAVPTRSLDTRLAAEAVIRDSGIPAVVVRPTMIYGRPGDRNIERLLRFLRRSPIMPVIGKGTGLQQPVHVDDLADAAVAIAGFPGPLDHAYNLPGPDALGFKHLVGEAAVAAGVRLRLLHIPHAVAVGAAWAWSRTGLPHQISSEQVRRLEEDKNFDPSPAAEAFGFQPREFSAGIAEEARMLGMRR